MENKEIKSILQKEYFTKKDWMRFIHGQIEYEKDKYKHAGISLWAISACLVILGERLLKDLYLIESTSGNIHAMQTIVTLGLYILINVVPICLIYAYPYIQRKLLRRNNSRQRMDAVSIPMSIFFISGFYTAIFAFNNKLGTLALNIIFVFNWILLIAWLVFHIKTNNLNYFFSTNSLNSKITRFFVKHSKKHMTVIFLISVYIIIISFKLISQKEYSLQMVESAIIVLLMLLLAFIFIYLLYSLYLINNYKDFENEIILSNLSAEQIQKVFEKRFGGTSIITWIKEKISEAEVCYKSAEDFLASNSADKEQYKMVTKHLVEMIRPIKTLVKYIRFIQEAHLITEIESNFYESNMDKISTLVDKMEDISNQISTRLDTPSTLST